MGVSEMTFCDPKALKAKKAKKALSIYKFLYGMYVSMNSSKTAQPIGIKLSEVEGLEASCKINYF